MVGRIFKQHFNSGHTAIRWKGKNISYGELDRQVSAYGAYLKKIGVAAGERVVLSCPNSPQFIYAYLGTVSIGSIIVPVNLLLTLEELQYISADSGAKYMIIHPALLQKAKTDKDAMEKALNVRLIVLDDALVAEIDALAQGPIDTSGEFNDESAVSTFLYTSGTTGKQKAAMLTHHNLEFNAAQLHRAFENTVDDVYLAVLPLFHVFGFTVGILTPLYSGATIVLMEGFQPKEVFESLSHDGITLFLGVPAMYTVLLGGKADVNFPKLRMAGCGGAALPVEVAMQAKTVLKLPIIEGYGLTEASPAAVFNPISGVQKIGSIGLPIPGTECIIGDENDNELPAGEVGELLVRGENIMAGYYGRKAETEEALRNGWLHTGDMAKKDAESYIFIVDRKKDMIIVSGFNVYSREVEEVIYQHPKVKEAAVVGIPDKRRGEYVKAFIVLKDGEKARSIEMLRYLGEHLASYKLPRRIQYVDSLPKNSSGKILKRMLRDTNEEKDD